MERQRGVLAMAGGKQAAAVEEMAAAPKGKGRLIVIALVALLVLAGGGGAAAYFLGLFGGAASAASTADGANTQAAGAHAGDTHGETPTAPAREFVFVDMPEMLVNLRSTSQRMRFLKLKVSLEVSDERTAEQLKLLTPRIIDGFQLYLRALAVDEVEGSAGMQALKEELMARINQSVAPSRVSDVLFKEILVQ